MRCRFLNARYGIIAPNLLRIVGRRCSMPWIDIEKTIADDETTEREIRQVIDFARRKAKPRFYADENFPELATAILRAFKADVFTVQEARLRGHPDENHTAEALRLG